jgi:hypothetical protein
VKLFKQPEHPATSYVVHLAQLAIQLYVQTFAVVPAVVSQVAPPASVGQALQVTTAVVLVPETEQEAQLVGHYFNEGVVEVTESLYHPTEST